MQVLRALYKKLWQDSVIQAVLSFPNQDTASVALQMQRQQWNQCAGQTVTISFSGSEDSSLQTSFVVDDTALNVS